MMRRAVAGIQQEPAAEVSNLIRELHEVDCRLQELTGGEIDTVLHKGTIHLLQHAQEQVRHGDAELRGAILNAIPAHAALLDTDGVIYAVNDSWRRHAVANGMRDPDFGVGTNYLTICKQAVPGGYPLCGDIAAGIDSVLRGEASNFSVEYPCDPPSGRGWFLLMVSALDAQRGKGAVVMHLNITAQKLDIECSERVVAAMNALTDGIILIDRTSMQMVHVNDAACRMYGLERRQFLELRPWDLLKRPPEEIERLYDEIIAAGGVVEPSEYLWSREDGTQIWVEFRRHARLVMNRWTIVILVRDISARKLAESRIAYLGRVHAVLSGINSLIVRAKTRADLFTEACRIAAEAGGFSMAWIGLVDRNLNRVVPVASQGIAADFLLAMSEKLVLDPAMAAATTLCAATIRDKKPIFVNNLQEEARAIFRAAYVGLGIRSFAILPLLVGSEAVGLIALYVTERDFFNPEEQRLLTELAGDIAFAIDHIDKQERLDYLAFYDVLTGLANRNLLLERLSQQARWAAVEQRKFALLFIDLERFKNINHTLGRAAGDSLLQQMSQWLVENAGDKNLVARVASDQFAVLLPDVVDEQDVATHLDDMLKRLSNHAFSLNDSDYHMAAKVGVAIYPDDATESDTLFRNAEAALKKAKVGGDQYLLYASKMTQTVAGRLGLENQLRQAINREEFVLHYQPKIRLADEGLVGVEALIRWNDPRTGLVPPQRFIPILEDTGLIHEVGRWALARAMQDYRRWRTRFPTPIRVAVNVSPLQLRDRRFISEIERVIGPPGSPTGLDIEITESTVMEDVNRSIDILHSIRSLGVGIAVDDFGTGFSSLSYLAKLPIDTLKIDRSFVAGMVAGPDGLSLISVIINLAHSLKLTVVAEGVETDEQKRLLHLLNCDEMQGYLFSRPLPAAEFEEKYLIAPGRTAAA